MGDRSCNGVGPNKKLAKRSAAESMLQHLGYSRPVPQPSKPAIKTSTAAADATAVTNSGDKKVTFFDADGNSSSGWRNRLVTLATLLGSLLFLLPSLLVVFISVMLPLAICAFFLLPVVSLFALPFLLLLCP